MKQMRPAVTKRAWHDPEDVGRAVVARHGNDYADQAGAACEGCQRWRWLPVSVFETPVMAAALADPGDVIASPETFGAGLNSFRHVLFRRALGQLLFDASPQNWRLAEVEMVHG